jgi:Flp pilus assembly protein TadD
MEAHRKFREGDLAAAVGLFERAVRENRTNARVLLRYAIALERAGQRSEAADAYRDAMTAQTPSLEGKEVPVAHNNLGLQLYEVLGESAEAEQHYRRSMAAAEALNLSSFWFPYKNLAQLLDKVGRTRESASLFSDAARLQDPHHRGALIWYASTFCAWVHSVPLYRANGPQIMFHLTHPPLHPPPPPLWS